jgi:23S rRNA maturation-related 3'-5' exoribonuclease YhaM
MQQELQNGVNELVQKLQNATTSSSVAEASEKGKQIVEKAFDNPAVTEAHSKVVKGLSNLNAELRKMANSLAEDKHTNDETPPKSE